MACGHICGSILLVGNWCGRANLGWEALSLGLGCIGKVTEKATGSKPVSRVPLWSLTQFLPWVPAAFPRHWNLLVPQLLSLTGKAFGSDSSKFKLVRGTQCCWIHVWPPFPLTRVLCTWVNGANWLLGKQPGWPHRTSHPISGLVRAFSAMVDIWQTSYETQMSSHFALSLRGTFIYFSYLLSPAFWLWPFIVSDNQANLSATVRGTLESHPLALPMESINSEALVQGVLLLF